MKDNIRTATLEKIKFGMREVVSEQLLDSNVDYLTNYLTNQVEYYIQGFIWGEEEKGYEFQYPSTWWEAFKERWFSDWAKNKWPVIYIKHVIDIKVIYPDLKISVPGQRYRVLINGNSESYSVKNDWNEDDV